jgi:hypothetical protein
MSFKASVALFGIFAAGGVALASPSPSPGEDACDRITAACTAAGYAPDGKEKNLERDCMKPILAGKAVPKVNVSGDDAKACKAHRTSRNCTETPPAGRSP